MTQLASFDLIVLFFVLGAFASWIGSDLQIPEPISKFLSIFLLLSLGLKGGHEVRAATDLSGFLPVLSIGILSCLIIPMILFFVLRNRLGIANAAAVSASYGSVSAITFVTAQAVLENEGFKSSGYMVAVMALMEIPAILVGTFLYQKFSGSTGVAHRSLFKSIFSSKSVVLLLGGFAIGLAMNQTSWDEISPVVRGCFKGALALFLLDIGLFAQKKFRETWELKTPALLVAIIFPLIFGSITLIACHWVGISRGDQILLAVLAGSGSYIAAPAAIRATILQANPTLYLGLPLALTFPMNLLLGIPLYIEISRLFTSNL